MNEIDELNIPRHLRKVGNFIEEIETGTENIKRFQKVCSVVNCSRMFVIMMDARRIRHEGYKRHLAQHSFGTHHRMKVSNSLSQPAKQENSFVYPSESIDFPEYSQVKIKQEVNFDDTGMESDDLTRSSRCQFKIDNVLSLNRTASSE